MISSIISAGAQMWGANKAASSAKKAAQLSGQYGLWGMKLQQDWEEKRAKNAHQWEMEDLKKAGLNPALTAMGGSGANTSGISAPSIDTSGITSAAQLKSEGVSKAIQSVIDMNRLKNENDINSAQVEKIQAEKENIDADTETKTLSNPYVPQKIKSEIAHNTSAAKVANSQSDNIKADTDFKNKTMDYRISQEFGKASQELYQGRLSDTSADFLNKYGLTKEDAFRLGEDGLKIIGALVGGGATKAVIQQVAKGINPKGATSAKKLTPKTGK